MFDFVASSEKVEQLEALVNTLREDFDALKTENSYLKLDIQKLQKLTTNLERLEFHGEKIKAEECNCNLTEIEHDIRQNGITIAKVRHDVVLNGEHTIQNHDNIEETKSEVDVLEATVNAMSMDFEATIKNVKADLEDVVDCAAERSTKPTKRTKKSLVKWISRKFPTHSLML